MENKQSHALTQHPARTVFLDYLRVTATIAVVVLHVCAQNWYTIPVSGTAWQTFNIIESIVRWCVPAFVMISGTLFLDREISMKKIYSKNILRLVISFFVWSSIYAVFVHGSVMDKVTAIIKGPFHMWFIFMIIGLYICLPIIKAIVKNPFTAKYFLVIALIVTFIFPTVTSLISTFGSQNIITVYSAIEEDINLLRLYSIWF